jgi:hypothetical protein
MAPQYFELVPGLEGRGQRFEIVSSLTHRVVSMTPAMNGETEVILFIVLTKILHLHFVECSFSQTIAG